MADWLDYCLDDFEVQHSENIALKFSNWVSKAVKIMPEVPTLQCEMSLVTGVIYYKALRYFTKVDTGHAFFILLLLFVTVSYTRCSQIR